MTIVHLDLLGFEALTQIQNLLENTALQTTAKESLIIDASNRFFTVIPSIHPHVIRDEDDFKSKVWDTNEILPSSLTDPVALNVLGVDALLSEISRSFPWLSFI